MPHWYGDSPPPLAICQQLSVFYTGTGHGAGKLTGSPNQRGTKQTCVCIGIELTAQCSKCIALHHKRMVVI